VRIVRHILGKEQRNEVTKAITAVLFERQEIVFAFVHGSFLSGSVFRDIDLGIFVEGIDRADFWDYEAALAQEIEGMLRGRFLILLCHITWRVGRENIPAYPVDT